MTRVHVLAVTLLLSAPALVGCTSVRYRDDDTVPETVGKTLVVVPAVVGVFLFEGFASDIRYRNERIETTRDLGQGEHDRYHELY